MSKINCWEYHQCGREPGGANAARLGVCLGATASFVDGINDGQNAGRCCWTIAGTFCHGQAQGTFSNKYGICKECDFYRSVEQEQGYGFALKASILETLRNIAE